MSQERLLFDTVKVDRGPYFVEYCPPNAAPFAMMQLIFPNAADSEDIAAAMEHELSHWLQRYDVPVMVSAIDGTGSLVSLKGVRESNHLFGWNDTDTGRRQHWRLVQDDEYSRGT